MDATTSGLQLVDAKGDSYFNLTGNADGTSFHQPFMTADEDMQTEQSDHFAEGFVNDEEMGSPEAKFNLHQETVDYFPSASLKNGTTPNIFAGEVQLQNDFREKHDEEGKPRMIGFEAVTDEESKIKTNDESQIKTNEDGIMKTHEETKIRADEESEIKTNEGSIIEPNEHPDLADGNSRCELNSQWSSNSFYVSEYSAIVSEVVLTSTHGETVAKQEPDLIDTGGEIKHETSDEDYDGNFSFHTSEQSIVSEVVTSILDKSVVRDEICFEVKQVPDDTDTGVNIGDKNCKQESVGNFSYEKKTDMSKLDMSSEDEEVNFDRSSAKSGAESSSSKDESPSGPSCSGTSRTGINSLSSDSEDDIRDVNISLPLKKRKRECLVETINSSSCSEDESKSEIDYTNLTPDEIKALIEEARRYGSIKRKCRCPKKKWEELPVKGPTETSSKCTIGKGDWSERSSLPCTACAAGFCKEDHKRGRSGRRKYILPRSTILTKPRARATIGEDVPIIELSDSEDISSVPSGVASEVTISTVPAGECIVLSSSEDDDDIVCIKAETKCQVSKVTLGEVPLMGGSPDVVVLNASSSQTGIPAGPLASQAFVPPVPSVPQVPLAPDSEPWPDFNIELDDWETMNLLANIVGPPTAGGMGTNGPQANAIVAVPERPSSPEGWSCPICLESKTAVPEIMSTTCGHIFCGKCIRSAVKIHKKCPTCRKKLTMKQFHKIFL